MTDEATGPTTPDGEGYDGPASVVAPDTDSLEVLVRLRGHFEPIDGRYHWWGRIQPSDALTQRRRSGDHVVLRTPYGEAKGRLSDLDPWGRFRITGTGRSPFPQD